MTTTTLVAGVVVTTFVLQDGKRNNDRIELVGRAPASGYDAILVAVRIELDDMGRYRVCSLYPISEERVQNRKEKGRLVIIS